MDDGVKILDPHIRATYRIRSAAYFDNNYFRSYIIVIPTVSSFQDKILFVFK